MYTIREHRKEVAITSAVMLGLAGFFVACLLLPWAVLASGSPWLAIPTAALAALAWGRWGLWATGGPAAVLSRVVIFGVSALVIFVAVLRILGF